MGWTPEHRHVTQLRTEPNGSVDGANDCFEASLARYLFETGEDVYQGMNDLELIAEIAEAARGTADAQDNPPTDIPECERALVHYGIKYEWTTSLAEARQSQMSICLVNGVLLSPPQYPAGWFGGENYPDHFLLWLPYWKGSTNWVNDPLSTVDCEYATIDQAFAGAFLLPAVPGQVFTTPRIEFVEGAAINSRPTHDPLKKTVLKRVAKGATGLYWGDETVVAGEKWSRVQVGAISGYVLDKAYKTL